MKFFIHNIFVSKDSLIDFLYNVLIKTDVISLKCSVKSMF